MRSTARRIRISAVTHRGLERSRNEDSLGWHGWSLHGHAPAALTTELDVDVPATVVVCDGLGGHSGGLEASRLACEILTAPDDPPTGCTVERLIERLGKRLQHASDVIDDIGSSRPHLAGMSCMVAGVTVLPSGRAVVFNVGGVRCYRVEGRCLARLTGDRAPRQALGGGRRTILAPDFFDCPLPCAPGIVLCTSGLDNYADAKAMSDATIGAGPELTSRLRDLALAGGGGDNVTIARVELL